MPANLEDAVVATGLEKVSFHSNLKERQCKECSNCSTTALISHASKAMLKLLRARLQKYVHKLESRLPGEISITSDMQMTPPIWQRVKRN